MLNAAAEAARKDGIRNVETRVMNAENIELDSDSFDAVICRIALMLFPNPAKALGEMHRVVKPGGKVAVMVYAALERNPYHAIFQETVRRLGNISWPAPDDPWMFALGAPGVLEGLYCEAGFQNVSIHAAPIPRGFSSAAAAVGNMRKAAGDLKELMTQLKEADREIAWAEIEEKFERFEGPNGFEVPGEVLVGVGKK
jgi:SAM-dependent methyltransferase